MSPLLLEQSAESCYDGALKQILYFIPTIAPDFNIQFNLDKEEQMKQEALQDSINEANVALLIEANPDKIDQFINFIDQHSNPKLQQDFIEIIYGNVNVNTPKKIGIKGQQIFGQIYNLFLDPTKIKEVLPNYRQNIPHFEEYKIVVDHITTLPKIHNLVQKLELKHKAVRILKDLPQAKSNSLAEENVKKRKSSNSGIKR